MTKVLHSKVALEAPCSYTPRGIKSAHDGILHSSLNQCEKTFLFEYLPVIRHMRVHPILIERHAYTSAVHVSFHLPFSTAHKFYQM